jgi:hypothetical protein
MRVFILKEGKEYNQGVAYLDDGTMVVVDNARKMIGKTIDISVTSVLQTTAGKMIFGSKSPSQFSEYWTFQRSVGVQTTGRSVLDKVCPNCGAPLEINQVGECRYCKAAVTSGRFDWVLSRIEQENEYSG